MLDHAGSEQVVVYFLCIRFSKSVTIAATRLVHMKGAFEPFNWQLTGLYYLTFTIVIEYTFIVSLASPACAEYNQKVFEPKWSDERPIGRDRNNGDGP